MSISNNGLCISKDIFNSLIEKYKRRKFHIKEKLPKNTPSHIQKHPRVLKLFKNIDSDIVHIGRNVVPDLDVTYQFNKCRKFSKFDLGDNIGDHQKIVLSNIVGRFSSNKGATYFCQMATGLGKTRLAIAVIGKVGATSLVIVPTKHIASQWIEEIEFLTELKVCLYTNPKNQSTEDYDIVIAIVNTARAKDKDFYSQFALTIIDEVHENISKINKKVMWLSSGCRFVLGLSATPEDTKNGLLPFIEGHIGKVVYSRDLPGYDILVKNFKVQVEICKYNGQEDYLCPVLNKGGTVSFVNTLAKIISDPKRIELVIEKIKELYDTGNNILVFAEHRKYLDNLYEKLMSIYKKEDIILEAKTLKGGATKEDIENCKKSRIILTTFCYSRRGIDYAHLNSLLMATPRKSGIRQIIGRILRFKSDDKIKRYIVDIWDSATITKAQLYERKKVYQSRQYDIIYSAYGDD